jgi:hypothetical protein
MRGCCRVISPPPVRVWTLNFLRSSGSAYHPGHRMDFDNFTFSSRHCLKYIFGFFEFFTPFFSYSFHLSFFLLLPSDRTLVLNVHAKQWRSSLRVVPDLRFRWVSWEPQIGKVQAFRPRENTLDQRQGLRPSTATAIGVQLSRSAALEKVLRCASWDIAHQTPTRLANIASQHPLDQISARPHTHPRERV